VSRGVPGRLHLLEFGLRWPPETFVGLKLERLAARGLRISVASTSGPPLAVRPRGVEIHAVVPSDRRGTLTSLAGGLWSVIAAFSRPKQAMTLVRAARRPTGVGRAVGRREAVTRLLAYARLRRQHPDLLHFEWGSAAVNYVSLIDALACPFVLSCHGDPKLYPATPTTQEVARAVPALFGRAAAVHCVAEAVRRDAVGLGLDPAKAWLIRGAVDVEFFRPAAEPRALDRGFAVVSVGGLRWLKGHEYALLAIAELAREGVPVTLDIVGGDPGPDQGEASQRARILHLVSHLGLGDRVRLHGELAPAQVRARLQRADVLLHASLSEGLPNVVLEAMACGLPVVATDVGGTSEAVRDGVEGLLIAPRDPSAAATALATLWRDPQLRQRMGKTGRERVATHFTLEHQTDQWIALYSNLVRAGA
jgi:glycosyltransferase involved in cell wall biosynthesis